MSEGPQVQGRQALTGFSRGRSGPTSAFRHLLGQRGKKEAPVPNRSKCLPDPLERTFINRYGRSTNQLRKRHAHC